MFERLKRALESALSALEARSGARPEEELDRLLRGMREELIEARARIPKIESAIRDGEQALRRETRRAEECARRAVQADAIEDRETVEVALRFEERHRSAAAVLAQKLEASRAELELQRRTVVDMTEQLKAATSRRDALAVRARTAGATERLRGSRPRVLDEFDRLAERMEGEEAAGRAAAEVEEALPSRPGGAAPGPDPEEELDPETLADARLRELKRRMAEEEGKGRR